MSKIRLAGLTLMAALATTILPGATVAQDEATPEGVIWGLTSYTVDGTAVDVPAGVEPELYMEDGEFNGNGGCNSIFGTYELDGSSLTFAAEMGMTMALCEGDGQVVEDGWVPLLGSVASWAIADDVLSMADADGTVLLTFAEPLVDITESDVQALLAELDRLNERINRTRQDVRSLNVPRIQNQVATGAEALDALAATVQNQNVPGLRQRVIANEEVLNELSDRFVNLRARVRDLERRVDALEQAVGLEATPANE
jgi:heat shock protein HslJ